MLQSCLRRGACFVHAQLGWPITGVTEAEAALEEGGQIGWILCVGELRTLTTSHTQCACINNYAAPDSITGLDNEHANAHTFSLLHRLTSLIVHCWRVLRRGEVVATICSSYHHWASASPSPLLHFIWKLETFITTAAAAASQQSSPSLGGRCTRQNREDRFLRAYFLLCSGFWR